MPPTTASPYAVGDLVTVVSDAPTFKTGLGPCPSSAKTGETYRVTEVWRDGDLTIAEPESVAPGRIVVSQEHVEAYIAPAITAPFGDYADLAEWQSVMARVALSYCTPQRIVTGIEAGNGWDTVQEGLDRAQAIIDEGLAEAGEPDDMDRRADALEAALDVLGDDRTVEEYVLAARFILGEEV